MTMNIRVITLSFLILNLWNCKDSSSEQLESEMSKPDLGKIEVIEKIAFGSCNRVGEKQILWDDIMSEKPDLWIWLGDIIYGDSDDLSILEKEYMKQSQNSGYQSLKATVPVMGIWDDHDYGLNNAGKEFESKKGSRDLLFKFLEVNTTNPAWNREGAYQHYYVGKNNLVHVILLDSRYFRDHPIYNFDQNNYTPNEEGTILGDAQWDWLEALLKESTASIHIIANGIQIIPEEHNYEKWANFPKERIKLFNLLSKYQVQRPILISGDRHVSEVSKLQWNDQLIYEVTSSGLTHSYENVGDEPNRFRISKLIGQKSFAVLDIDPELRNIQVRLKGDNGYLWDSVKLEF
jgi:alkaline phosphatase D